MRPRPGLLAITALTGMLAACGGGSGGGRITKREAKPLGCAAVFVSERVTRSQIADVEDDLRGEPFVHAVRLVSKEKSLEYSREKYPELANSLAANPLPDALYVTPRSAADLPAVAETRRFGKLVEVVMTDGWPCPTGQ